MTSVRELQMIRNYLHQTRIGSVDLLVDYDYETEPSDLTASGVCHYVYIDSVFCGEYDIADLLSGEVHDRIEEEILHELAN